MLSRTAPRLLTLFALALVLATGAAFGAPLRIPAASGPTTIVATADDPELVRIAAGLLADDIQRVTGYRPEVVDNVANARGQVIVLGTATSSIVRQLMPNAPDAVRSLGGQWETYAYAEIENPALPGGRGFLIAGSDRRGVAYGALALSRKWGVSPWYWWADAPVAHRDFVELPQAPFRSASPAVKYRGIFINDEDWGLEPWAAHTFEPEVGTIGPRTYARVCELLLRLNANLLWPAMHDCTRAFYRVPGNAEVADRYGIVIGTSHAEPMLRNNVDEWDAKARGPFDFVANRQRVLDYWRERVGQTTNREVIYTLGMRGIHDSPMVGVASMAQKIAAMQDVLAQQRGMLKAAAPDRERPQVFVPYKEVLEAYDAGLQVPDDVTLMWTDDNFGYIRRLSSPAEQKRSGRAGVYYHVSYWGQPHDYLWLATTHPMLVWEEMSKAYDAGADRIWVLNVGDIKPAEYLTQFFMDLAVSPDAFRLPETVRQHLRTWAAENVGAEHADEVAGLLWNYYGLAFERRPEHLGWNSVEPTTAVQPSAYNAFEQGDQTEIRLERYAALERQADELAGKLPPASRDAFFQLVQYPVRGAGAMNRKVLYREKAEQYARQHRASANDYARLAREAEDQIAADTRHYNETMAAGKWRGIMSAAPRNLPVFSREPGVQWTPAEAPTWGVVTEGPASERPSTEIFGSGRGDARSRRLPTFTRGLPQQAYIDIVSNAPLACPWTAEPSADWIVVSRKSGELSAAPGNAQQRLWVSVDASRVPARPRSAGKVRIQALGRTVEVTVTVVVPPERAQAAGALVESAGYVAFDARDFSDKRDDPAAPWTVLDGLGVSGAAVGTLPVAGGATVAPERAREYAPYIEYTFHVLGGGEATVAIGCLPTLPVDRDHGVRFAAQIDDGEPSILDIATQGRSPTWKENVLSNRAVARLTGVKLAPGEHRLRLYRIDPGVIFDSVTIDLGGLPKGYGHVQPTKVR